jgi:hypothetical protein
MEELKMKYVNPEYVSILAVSEDVITLSLDKVQVDVPEGANYTQTKDVWYNEDGEAVKVGTTISANLGALGI